jgi:hypothetical protein
MVLLSIGLSVDRQVALDGADFRGKAALVKVPAS